MFTNEGYRCNATYQIADIERPLMAVGKVCDQNNEVIFRQHGGTIKNLTTGTEINFERKNGVYILETWVMKGESTSPFMRQG